MGPSRQPLSHETPQHPPAVLAVDNLVLAGRLGVRPNRDGVDEAIGEDALALGLVGPLAHHVGIPVIGLDVLEGDKLDLQLPEC
ncbi:hypothetical protein D3C72_993210 [compost metagenome]